MEKTHVSVEFAIFGESINIEKISKDLNITPTLSYHKGEPTSNPKVFYKEDCWEIDTGYKETFYVVEEIEKVMAIFRGKENE
ncbi:DUF4279 domain-containing protein [Rummeliibacillus sp. TYF-LIM-RU47]|uniref:DUF4279 domain-containing protein n=1 Tax=Rummeliibacillus sp. TYF-LIM-RU47 TaxID=2608406 RepID=UPI0016810994|nr:DUF4279 domain-containing protein [Rummeliibacillus sp. TYF-LIM-RU47]